MLPKIRCHLRMQKGKIIHVHSNNTIIEAIYFEHYFGVRPLCNRRFNKYMDMRLHFSLRFIKHREISHYGERVWNQAEVFLTEIKKTDGKVLCSGKRPL